MDPAITSLPPLPNPIKAGPSTMSAAEKWFNPLGPPPGSTFGARIRKNDEDIFSHNAWCVSGGLNDVLFCAKKAHVLANIDLKDRDHVELTDEYRVRADKIIALQSNDPVTPELRGAFDSSWSPDRAEGPAEGYNSQPAHYWDSFYSRNHAAQVRSGIPESEAKSS